MLSKVTAIFVYFWNWWNIIKFSQFWSDLNIKDVDMGRKKTVTPRKRAIIAQYNRDGLKPAEISRQLKMARSTVSQLIGQFADRASTEARKSSGRPRITSKRDDTSIGRCAKIHPSYSSMEIKVHTGTAASCRTIRRRLLKEFQLPARRPAKKPLLNDKQRKKRINFCKKYSNWTSTDWHKVLFSDETTICQFGSTVTLVRRPSGTRFLPKYTVATMKHPPKVMVWGCFSASGRGSLYFLAPGTTVNADVYIEILSSKVPNSLMLSNCTLFQQDSAPAHTAKKVRNWMTNKRIEVLEWPGNSPDLNPIENLWMLLKRKVKIHQPKNMQELIFYIKRVWCLEINTTLCKSLVDSMPRRINKVLASKGYATKY